MPAVANLVELDELTNEPFSQFGQNLTELITLTKNHLPVPACLVVTKQALNRIALANPNFQAIRTGLNQLNSPKFSTLNRSQSIEAIAQKIAEFAIPQQFTNEYYQTHEKYFGDDAVDIASETGNSKVNKVQGEVNILKTILFTWSREFIHQAFRQKKNIEFVPSRIVLIAESHSIFRGKISSKHPEAKHHAWLRVSTAHGSCWLDSRSWVVIEKPRELTLNNASLIKIGQVALPLFQKNLHSLTLRWSIDQQHRLWFLGIEHSTPPLLSVSSCSLQTATKHYLSLTPTTQLSTSLHQIDGVMALNSEQFFHLKGFHPNYIISTAKEKKVLKTSVQNHLRSLAQKFPGKFLSYRSYAASADQRARLHLGQTYDNLETNPFFGRRGPSYILNNPSLFNFELEIISEHLAQFTSPFGLIIPWIRSKYEFQQMYQLINQTNLNNQPHFSLWLELNNPGLILADDLPNVGVSGYIINVQNLVQTSFGLDPTQPDLDTVSTTEVVNLLQQLMKNLSIATMRLKQQLVLLQTQIYPELIQEVVKLGWHGVSTTIEGTNECNSLLLKNEKELINLALNRNITQIQEITEEKGSQ